MIDQLEFLKLHLLDGESYLTIVAKYSVSGSQLSAWWEDKEGKRIRASIKRSNTMFNNRVESKDFKYFEQRGKRFYYEWISQLPDTCAYCGTEERVLRILFNSNGGLLSSKRKRGASLELERKDAKGNLYTEDNCALVCYLCNNHKSDVISEADHCKYFAPAIHKYLMDKYREHQQTVASE